jgi:hypothetical protein
MKRIKKVYGHPMSWMATLYVAAFAVAFGLFGPVALIHPAAVACFVCPLLTVYNNHGA